MFSLRVLGGVSIEGPEGPLTGPVSQRRRLALLCVLALARGRPVSRDRLLALFWPESDTDRARHSLADSVYQIRKELGENAVLASGDDLRLNVHVVRSDAAEFEAARERGRLDEAVAAYGGPLLDGFHLSDAPEFEPWLERERERLARAYASSLEALAEAAEARRDFSEATARWQMRVALDPYDSRIALRLMQALEASGNPAGALQHALLHARLLREEFEVQPPPEVAAFVAALRAREPAGLPANATRPSMQPRAVPGDGVSADASSPLTVAAPSSGERIDAAAEPPSRWSPVRRPLPYALAALLVVSALPFVVFVSDGSRSEVPVDSLARSIARELVPRLGAAAPRCQTKSIAAYELYLAGDDSTLNRVPGGQQKALEFFEQAIAKDSSYAAAWAGIALKYISIDGPPRENIARGRQAADRAIALCDSLAAAHAARGVIHMRDYEWTQAEARLLHAIDLEPSYIRAREYLVGLYVWTGRAAEALRVAERTLQLAPQSPVANAEYARALAANGRCAEAISHLEALADLAQPLQRAGGIELQCYGAKDMWREGLEKYRSVPDGPARLAVGYFYGRAGKRQEALRILAGYQESLKRDGYGAYAVGVVYAGLGRFDEAIEMLERSIEEQTLFGGPSQAPGIMSPMFAELHRQPGFARVRAALNLQNR